MKINGQIIQEYGTGFAAHVAAHAVLAGNTCVYRIWHADGGDTYIVGTPGTDIEAMATAWIQAGEWGDGLAEVEVEYSAISIDEFGDEVEVGAESIEVTCGTLPEPEPCESEDGHDWQSPVEIVGGCAENPGVFSSGGTRFDFYEICQTCGMRKHSWDQGAQRNPGQASEGVEYEAATERSLAWAGAQ